MQGGQLTVTRGKMLPMGTEAFQPADPLLTYYNVQPGRIGGEFGPFEGLHGGGDGQAGVRQGQADGLFPKIQPKKPQSGRQFQIFQRDNRHQVPLILASGPPGC